MTRINPEQIRAWFESHIPNNGKTIRWTGNDAVVHSPLREDKSPSFSINCEKGSWHDLATGDKGGIVALAQRLNVDPPECFQKRREAPKQRTHEGTFIYVDERGNPLLKIERYRNSQALIAQGRKEKEFPQSTMVNGSWRKGGYQRTTGNPNPLYRLDEIHNNPTATVYIYEGEIKVDRAREWSLPGVHTCWPGGAKSINTADFTPLHGRDVVLVPDNDGPGKKAMAKIADLLSGKAKSVKVASYPEDFTYKGDLCDCASPEEARAILARAKPWAGVVDLPQEPPKKNILDIESTLDWSPGNEPPEKIGGIFPRAQLSILAGPAGVGKSVLMQYLCSQWSMQGLMVGYITGELPKSLMQWRQKTTGWEYNPANFKIFSAIDAALEGMNLDLSSPEGLKNFRIIADSRKWDVLVLDSLTGLTDGNESDPEKMNPLTTLLLRLASEKNCAIPFVHHPRKKKGFERKDRMHLDDVIGTSTLTRKAGFVVGVEVLQEAKEPEVFVSVLKNWTGKRGDLFSFTIHGEENIYTGKSEIVGLTVNDNPIPPAANTREAVEAFVFEIQAPGVKFAASEVSKYLREVGVSVSGTVVNRYLGEFIDSGRLERQGKTKNALYWAPDSKGENPEEKDSQQGFSIGSLHCCESSIQPSDTNGFDSQPPVANCCESPKPLNLFATDSQPPVANPNPCGDWAGPMIHNIGSSTGESCCESSGESSFSTPPEVQDWYSSLPEDDRQAIRGREEMLLAFPGISSEDRKRISRQLIEAAYLDSQRAELPPSELRISFEEEDEGEEPDPPEGGSPPSIPEASSGTEPPEDSEFDPHQLDKLRELRKISGEADVPPSSPPPRERPFHPERIPKKMRSRFFDLKAVYRREGATPDEAYDRAEEDVLREVAEAEVPA